MRLICLDMEGVLTPEIWINVAERTRIPELRRTTRDEPDYDRLMRGRIAILKRHGVTLRRIQSVIGTMDPLPGAKRFLDKLRHTEQVVILSDTFYEFAMPLMKKLGYPTLLCNRLLVDRKGFISGYTLRQADGKRRAVLGFNGMGFSVTAAGDSYNDLSMLKAAERGVLFNPPDRIARDNPSFRVTRSYAELLKALRA